MKLIRSFSVAALACNIFALPHDGTISLEKRQLLQSLGLPKGVTVSLSSLSPSTLSSIMPLLRAATTNNLGEFFGAPEASE